MKNLENIAILLPSLACRLLNGAMGSFEYFLFTMFIYKIFHSIFAFLWIFHFINAKLVWWLLWIPTIIFIITLNFNEDLRIYIDKESSKSPIRKFSLVCFTSFVFHLEQSLFRLISDFE